jgi:hypothetical protein
MHNNGIVSHCYVFLLTQQYVKIESERLLYIRLGESEWTVSMKIIIILYFWQINFFLDNDYLFDFFQFILNPEQRRVFQLVVNNKEEAVVAKFMPLYRHLSGGTLENNEKLSE